MPRIGMILAVLAVLFHGNVPAETGMCLVIDQGVKGYDLPGDLLRIDMKDDAIVATSEPLATSAFCPRFNPDGTKIAYTKNANTMYICDLQGNVETQFACNGKWVSWTTNGVWAHKNASGLFTQYNPSTGAVTRTVNVSGVEAYAAFVAQNEKTIGMHYKTTQYGNTAGAILLDSGNQVKLLGPGCSVGVSPDGNLFTNNLWESGMEHQTMKIWNRSGAEVAYYYIYEILPLRGEVSWNRQCWSGNSNDCFIIPAGQNFTGESQQYKSTVPFIYNMDTETAHCFHTDYRALVFWFPYDYYQGKIFAADPPVATEIEVSPASATVAPSGEAVFTAVLLDQYGAAMASQPSFTWSVTGGGTMSGGTFTAGSSTGGPYTVKAAASGLEGTAQVTVATVLKRINCGSNGSGFDQSGWEQDDSYIVGHSDANDYDWTVTMDASGVTDAAPDNVYKSVYHYEHEYSFPGIANGTYTLRFHFADQYDASTRAMEYIAEGQTVISGLSITDLVGTGKALVKDVGVTVSDGNGLQIDCNKASGNDVFECGLEILAAGTAVTDRALTPSGRMGITVSGNPLRTGETIRFMLPEGAYASLVIHTTTGRIIHRAAGTGSLVWDGTYGTCASLKPGIYGYRLRTGGRETAGTLLITE